MSYNLTNQAIEDSFQPLLQIDSGSALRDGTGSLVDNINVTASYALTASFAENVIPIDTGSLLTTASFDNGTRNLTFTKGDSSTFSVNIPDVSGSDLPSGVVSGSSQIILTDTTGNLGGNRITGSVSNAVSSSYAISASYAVSASYEIIKEISSSFADHTNWSGIYGIPSGLVSGSSQVVLEDTTFTDGVTDQFLSTDGGGNISFDWVKTLHQNIHNATTSSIVRGTPLYISGSTGDNANVYFADASNTNRRPATLIAFDQTLAPGETGTGIISGEIQGVNTNLYPEGTIVYLGVGGGWTATRPTGSNTLVQALGVITRQANNGRGIVFNQIGNNLPNIQEGYAWVGDSSGVPQAVATSSFAVSIDTGSLVTTASFNAYTQSTDARLNSIELETSSLDGRVTSLENFSSSLDTTFATDAELASATASLINSIATKLDTGSYLTDSASFDSRIDNLENFSSSLDSNFVSETEFGIYTSSNDSKVNSLIAATGSYATTGSNLFTGIQTISGSSAINNELRIGSKVKITDQPDFITTFEPSKIEGIQQIVGNVILSGSNYWQANIGNRTQVGINGSQQSYRIGFGTPYASSLYTYQLNSGSAEFRTDLDVRDTLTSRQAESNVIYNPQTISENITIPTNKNAFIVGAVTISGELTLDTGSELYIHTPADLGGYLQTSVYQVDSASFDTRINNIATDTGSLATTGSNTFTGNQFISGSTTALGGLEIGSVALDQQAALGVLGQIILRSGSGIVSDGSYGPGIPFDSPVNFFDGIALKGSASDLDAENNDIVNVGKLKLSQSDPLPTGGVGDLAVSASNLYFHNGTSWSQIN